MRINTQIADLLRSGQEDHSRTEEVHRTGMGVRSDVHELRESPGEPFAQVYHKVADANAAAREETEQTHRAAGSVDTQKRDRMTEDDEFVLQVVAEAITGPGAVQESPKVEPSVQQAVEIIRESMDLIARVLNLDVSKVSELDSLDLANPSDAVKEQFAEILVALRGIASVLRDAAEADVALDVKGVVIGPAQAVAVEKSVRVQMFRLEMALETLGVVGDISRKAAEKMQAPVMDGGVPQATDPGSISMPKGQIEQVLGNLLESGEHQVQAVVARMAALAREKAGQQPKVVSLQGTKPKAEVAVVASPENEAKPGYGEIARFDAPVLRKLLKVDGAPESQSKKVDSEVSTDKPLIQGKMAPGSVGAASKVLFQKMLQSVEPVEQTGATERGMDARLAEARMVRPSVALPRAVEESVLHQIAERVVNAARTGTHQVRLLLRPESLGQVRITIRMDGDIVMARMTVENQQVKQIVESNLQSLRDALEERGLETGSFDVNVNKGSDAEDQAAWMAQKNNDGSHGGAETEETTSFGTQEVVFGGETGRRFGSNSFEYLA